ncbi:hypothetical protein [Mesorhizobium sp. ZC-5]|uniref:hypothetical protein n=1 Tax=Mesorhizobium sp. ZC-5 TaxID=2986066 RepID=UPI0021E94E46|nr:hypothetical protein [Mesorhizobium sp. ZC-5]MCV3241509.1 hypothetical protein [Mesorhizobium sp. ZC-5]
MDPKYLGLSLLRAVVMFALFVGSWLLAYVIGQLLAGAGLIPCRDAAECELMVGIQVMPLGGTALYVLFLVVWSLAARHHRTTQP